VSNAAVAAHLEEILDSPAFKSSQRSRQFLQYVVNHTLDGNIDLLKERLIGERVFGRTVGYDTGQDSIVRVKANEVRRRLAQYYDLHPHSPIRIDLPLGSYAVQIRAAEALAEPPAPAPPPAPSALPIYQPRWWPWIALGLAATAAAVIALGPFPAAGPFELFWRPFVSAPSLLLCIPTPEAFRIYGTDRQPVIDALRPRAPGQAPRPLPNPLGEVSIVPEPGMFLGIGDARAMTLLHTFAAQRGVRPVLRVGSITTFSELRAGPSVLIGGVTNPWTADLTRELRFNIVQENRRHGIRDHAAQKMLCSKHASWEQPRNEDCAVITRLPTSKTGHPMLIAAGLDHYGTFAAGEFLTQPAELEAALRGAPPGWESKTLQIVFRVERVGDNTGPPKILETQVF
jgi:hypothetical protein